MLSELRRRKFTRYFQSLDENRDGVLELRDVQGIVRNLAAIRGIAPGSPEYQILERGYFTVWATNSRMTLDEFLDVCDFTVRPGPEFDAAIRASSDVVFDLMDRDHDGKITPTEYDEYLRAHHLATGSPDEIFTRLDLDGDGFLSRKEYQQLVQEFLHSEDENAPGNWLWGPF